MRALLRNRAKTTRRLGWWVFFVQFGVGAQIPIPPPAAVRPITNNYFGTEVIDPYRWMEDASCPDFQSWVKLQGDYARAKLKGLAIRKELLAELWPLDASLNTYPGGLRPIGDRLFYMRTPPPTDVYQLFMRDGLTGAEKLVFDPNQLSAPEGAHYALGRYYVAPDGKGRSESHAHRCGR